MDSIALLSTNGTAPTILRRSSFKSSSYKAFTGVKRFRRFAADQWNTDGQTCQNRDQEGNTDFSQIRAVDAGTSIQTAYIHDPSQDINNNRIIHLAVPLFSEYICSVHKAPCSGYDAVSPTGSYPDHGRYGCGRCGFRHPPKILAEIQLCKRI